MYLKKAAIGILVCISFFSCAVSKNNNKSGHRYKVGSDLVNADSLKKTVADSVRRNKPKPYNEVITAKTITDSGLFTIHKIDDRYLFEIPDSLIDKDILLVSRIAKGAADYRPAMGFWGYAGDQIGEKVIRFCKGPGDKLFIKTISYWERSLDSSENGMYRTVHNSNFLPIVGAFDIKAYRADSTGMVIDVTDFLSSDNNLIYFDARFKGWYGLGGLQKDKSYIANIQSFPVNVELQAVNTYQFGEITLSYELNTSFVLLPKSPMKPRYMDQRVGYFSRIYMDFDRPQNVWEAVMITRFRMEPKEEDKEKYMRGELVEPKNPIVYYIDPATPRKWVSYLIQGVNDWQKAFEKAGFKNAIYAREAPKNDPEFNLFDARHNAIIYKASAVANASGPQVHDPRTGEILETHINWYHNVIQLLHDWYMVQAGINDPKARKMIFDDSLMGQLIRFVACHEVGHTLGLLHNFGSSSTVPVDSLRSKSYLEKNGFCPSIMDYARFNYVAQPEDSISQRSLFPRIGVYDEWAIEWGYRWLPQLKTRDEEKAFMNAWIINSLEKDKRLWYGAQTLGISDPRCQNEDLGDDAMKAGYYGIKNLKKVVKHLREWTKEPNEDFKSLGRIENEVIAQYYRYVMHVAYNIGTPTMTPKTQQEKGPVMGFVPKEKQKRAVEFLTDYLFEAPVWLNEKEITLLLGGPSPFLSASIQMNVLNSVINISNFASLEYFHAAYPDSAYTFDELLTDLETGIFKELKTGKAVDFYRRSPQKIYVEKLIEFALAKEDQYGKIKFAIDLISICRMHLKSIMDQISKTLSRYKDNDTHMHLVSLRSRIRQALDVNPFLSPSQGNANNVNPTSFGIDAKNSLKRFSSSDYESESWRLPLKCWQNGSELLGTELIYLDRESHEGH